MYFLKKKFWSEELPQVLGEHPQNPSIKRLGFPRWTTNMSKQVDHGDLVGGNRRPWRVFKPPQGSSPPENSPPSPGSTRHRRPPPPAASMSSNPSPYPSGPFISRGWKSLIGRRRVRSRRCGGDPPAPAWSRSSGFFGKGSHGGRPAGGLPSFPGGAPGQVQFRQGGSPRWLSGSAAPPCRRWSGDLRPPRGRGAGRFPSSEPWGGPPARHVEGGRGPVRETGGGAEGETTSPPGPRGPPPRRAPRRWAGGFPGGWGGGGRRDGAGGTRRPPPPSHPPRDARPDAGPGGARSGGAPDRGGNEDGWAARRRERVGAGPRGGVAAGTTGAPPSRSSLAGERPRPEPGGIDRSGGFLGAGGGRGAALRIFRRGGVG